ncbi:hypothetical protein PIB30_026750 [Stylosanthes scabra]|uniref:Uncharacterized protein n=1 Tax=Stylosanthes scabra TaxID=79078 RepID=A0ABU6VAQ3_9FABA|nr:hypothetical protein [Stylosanthes scabra]
MATLVRKKIAAYAPCSRRSHLYVGRSCLPDRRDQRRSSCSKVDPPISVLSVVQKVWVEDRRLRARANKRPEPEKKSLEADDCASRRGLLSCHLFLIIIRISPGLFIFSFKMPLHPPS